MKVLALTLSVAMLCVVLASCGGSAKLAKAYTTGTAYYIDGIGWYNSDTYTLKLNPASRASAPSSSPASTPRLPLPTAGRPTRT